MGEKLLLDETEVCELLGISDLDLTALVVQGKFPSALRLPGDKLRWSGPGIMAWLEDNCPVCDQGAWKQYLDDEAQRIADGVA